MPPTLCAGCSWEFAPLCPPVCPRFSETQKRQLFYCRLCSHKLKDNELCPNPDCFYAFFRQTADVTAENEDFINRARWLLRHQPSADPQRRRH